MCGIAGFSGNFDRVLLQKMGSLLSHRGPDDAGDILLSAAHKQIGLAHRRLSIIDLSAEGHQPMTVDCECCSNTVEKQLWLTYNGELYNYRELRNELIAKGHQFKSQTDSEILLHLYAEEGPSMLKRLNGIFAFAIYDGRRNGQKDGVQSGDLFLARDGIGVKPLYYTETTSGFLFASELKALIACKQVERCIDPIAIHYYLAYLWCPGQKTALTAVSKVEPGEAMLVRNGRLAKRWYFYDFPYHGSHVQSSEEEISLELDQLFTQAVKRQLIADVPIGAFLSGGLDSSAIVAAVRKLKPTESIHCYSIGFHEGMQSEGNPNDLPYAKSVAQHLNIHHHVLEVEANIIQHLQRMIYHLDEPQADPAPIHVLLIAEAARRDGIKVLLSGAGGDDIFSGYRRHQTIYAEQFWKWVPVFMRQGLSNYAHKLLEGGNARPVMRHPFMRRLAKLFAHAHLPMDRRIVNYFMWSTENLRKTLYSPDMAAHIEHIDTASPLLHSLNRIPNETDPLNRMLYLEGKHFLADHNLNYTDKMSMAVGVEVRVPLLDPDLIAFAARIPSHLKQKGKVGKAIFKKTMEPYLPHKIIYRPKAGFGAPLRRWIHRELQPLVNDILSAQSIKNRGLFDTRAISNLIQWDREGRIDAAYTIFSLLCIELWCRAFID